MKLHLLITTTILTLFSAAAFAACEHYAGHFDLEGKIGNQRNIGEASAFLPIACTQDRLLFTDLKFRADNLSNREANIGIGGRIQREDGIAGGYIYFDRKKSGETDKFYTQITTGAEWLADHWETRANLYIPLNGAKNVSATTSTSNPYLAGSNIFIDQAGFVVKETPMYGADAEIGFQTTENLWLYGGGFTFHGNDVPTITGARVRAKYDLTDKVSLNAEGQYDDERGRQGWLGARLSVPFGNANAARSRMTQSPVRDIDIVTQTKQQQTFQSTTPLSNPESGDAQRVIYVNNRAAANGDGSLENPYNTLADAQTDLRDYDIVYVFHGDGTTTGQDQGFVIDKDNVSFIGEGSPFVYAGHLLRPAGQHPVITNGSSHGVYLEAANALVAGLKIDSSADHGLYAYALGKNLGNVTAADLISTNNAAMGLYFLADIGGAIDRLTLHNIDASYNTTNGISVSSSGNGGVIDNIQAFDIKSTNNAGSGFFITAGSPALTGWGIIERAHLERFYIADNNGRGFMARASGDDSWFEDLTVRSLTSQNNGGDRQVWIETTGGNATFNHVLLSEITARGASQGIAITVNAQASILDLKLQDSNIMYNNTGLRLFGVGTLNVDLNGNNRFSNNNTYDLAIRIPSGVIDARNNWWGQEGGPLSGQITYEQTPPNTATVDTSDWLEQDPRP